MSTVLFQGRHNIDRRAEQLIASDNADDDALLDTLQMSQWLAVSTQWLEIGRSRGWGPPFLKLGPRRVRYHKATVKQWLAERSFRCTGEYPVAAQERREAPPGTATAGKGNSPPPRSHSGGRVRLNAK
jgi:hypothetical protein